MNPVIIHTFGGLSYSSDNNYSTINQSQSLRAIFAKLILEHDQWSPRDSIAESIWPEVCREKSRSNLNSAIWRLKKDLKKRYINPHISIRGDKDFVQLNLTKGVLTDFDMLCREVALCEKQLLANGSLNRTQILSLQNAVQTYVNDFMPGLDHDWAICARERFRMRYVQACTILMEAFAQRQEFESALKYAHKILDKDELRETIHHRIIEIYIRHGLRQKAVEQYNRLKKLLYSELGLKPQSCTQDLISGI